jgi:penicillin-binding protein 1A
MPSLTELENPAILQASEVYAADGTLMGKYYTERGNRSPVRYREISPNVIDALIATEDERFYDHNGIDFKSTLRAVLSLGTEGGGSTITQQLAKALLAQGSKNKAWRVIEKLKEWIIAIKLERNFSKQEIITLYLNTVPFGNNLYGIRNTARTFFQKEPIDLKVEEAALLVGLLKGNTIYNPIRNPKSALDRRNIVIGQMEVNQKISSADAAFCLPQVARFCHAARGSDIGLGSPGGAARLSHAACRSAVASDPARLALTAQCCGFPAGLDLWQPYRAPIKE